MSLHRRFRLPLLISLTVLAVLAMSLAVRAASAGATVKLAPDAALANPPNAVIVSVTYSCLPSQFSFGQVQVDQAQSGGSASGSRGDVFGFGSFQPLCDDKAHKATVIASTFDGSTFLPGTAGASAFVASGAVFASTQAEVTIK